jgi:hydrogenase maturation protein HypF
LAAAARIASEPSAPTRVRARVEGTVQGVGFRPYVHRLAREERLVGYVLNDEHGVLLEVEGSAEAVERFLARLPAEAPPLASIEAVVSDAVAPKGERDFQIVASTRHSEPAALVAPDSATCAECLAELLDPADRRHRYPFINCTNCGPRFTIVRGVPYDRPLTTMAGFAMCPACRREYDDPTDRRFHAQPNACPECGPTVRAGDEVGEEALRAAAAALLGGAIVAVKGVGGFHLACRADDEDAVARLRTRKKREDKPFALMARDLDAAGRLVVLRAEEAVLLSSFARPIVLAPRRPEALIADAVAPAAPELGVMLPYSPLHHLLLADTDTALVMTSGNVSDEPIAYRDDDALERLPEIADLFLTHDRPIHTRTDDSVVRVVRRGAARVPLTLRRSRGYVPRSLKLPVAGRPALACGADLKSTFCVAKGSRAWVSHHVGDLEHYPALRAYGEGLGHFQRLFAVKPEVVAHDLHPGYHSTGWALGLEDVELVGVQHHHAHLAACLAEHAMQGPALGAIFDGTGYGTDGTVWGGELLVGDLRECARVASLWPVRMPGGAAAIREPWRMACAWLTESFDETPALPRAFAGSVDEATWRAMTQIARNSALSPVTTSMGRLFDAVAALCGVGDRVSYEGQAAIALEAAADAHYRGAYELALIDGGDTIAGGLMLDARETVRAVWCDREAGTPVATIAGRFHAAIADATVRACLATAGRHGLDTVVLSGGVFQNRRLLEGVAMGLHASGLRVLTPEKLPPNDGGISYGQAAIAAARAC